MFGYRLIALTAMSGTTCCLNSPRSELEARRIVTKPILLLTVVVVQYRAFLGGFQQQFLETCFPLEAKLLTL